MSKARNLSDFISDAAIDATEIGSNAVTTDKIIDQAVTPAKLHNTLDLSSKTVTLPTGGISGNAIDGGVISNFASTGIDDNASSTAVTILSDGKVGIGTSSPTGVHSLAKVLELDGGDGSEINLGLNAPNVGSGAFVGGIGFKNVDGSLGTAPHYAGIKSKTTSTLGTMDLRFYSGTGNYEADTPQMLLDASGNVGIGSTGPTTKLEITESSGYTGYEFITLSRAEPTRYRSTIGFGDYAGGNKFGLSFTTRNDSTDYRTMTMVDGNVGIGTDSPNTLYGAYTTPLVVTSPTSGALPYIEVRSAPNGDQAGILFNRENSTGWMTAMNNSGKYRIAHMAAISQTGLTNAKDGNDGITVQTNGNVGIGTHSPEVKLEVNGGGDGSVVFAGRSDGGNGNNRRFNLIAYADGGGANYGGGLKIQTRDSVNVFNDRLTVTSSGKVLINTTDPQDDPSMLRVLNSMSNLGSMYIGKVHNSTNNNNAAILLHRMGQGQGHQFSGKFIVNSWTGNRHIDCHITSYYITDAVSVNTNFTNSGGISAVTVRLCTVNIGGVLYLAFVKDGGGSGVSYLNAFIEGNIHYQGGIREVLNAGQGFTVTTTHYTF